MGLRQNLRARNSVSQRWESQMTELWEESGFPSGEGAVSSWSNGG